MTPQSITVIPTTDEEFIEEFVYVDDEGVVGEDKVEGVAKNKTKKG